MLAQLVDNGSEFETKENIIFFEPRIKFNRNIYINCCLKKAKHWIRSLFFLHLFYFQLTFRYHEPFHGEKLQQVFLFRNLCLSRLSCPRGNWSANWLPPWYFWLPQTTRQPLISNPSTRFGQFINTYLQLKSVKHQSLDTWQPLFEVV